MTKKVSLYLDLLRFLAAVAVFFSHIKRKSITYGAFDALGAFGQEGVVVFFVISGVVIAHVAATKEHAPIPYAVARLARLWSVVVPAILLTIALDVVGMRLAPAMYDEPGLPPVWAWNAASVWRAIAPILFLNQTRWWIVSPGTNGPFWSLGYEFWYYVAFGVWCFSRGSLRIVLLVAIAVLVGDGVISMFPIWLLGVYIYSLLQSRSEKPSQSQFYTVMWMFSIISLALLMLFKFKIMNLFSAVPPSLSWLKDQAGLMESYIVGIVFAFSIFTFSRTSPSLTVLFERMSPYIRAAAKRTFSLYLYQAPLIFFFGAATAAISLRPLRVSIVIAATGGTILLLAGYTELKKHVVARWLVYVVDRRERQLTPVGVPFAPTRKRPNL